MNEAELRAENASLKQQLEAALNVNMLSQAELIARAMDNIASSVMGDDGLAKISMACTCVNCGASFHNAEEAMAHDEVCPKHPAAIRAAKMQEALAAAAEYIGDESAGSMEFWERYYEAIPEKRGG